MSFSGVKAVLKRLRSDHWAWVNAKVALILWGLAYIIYTPPGPLKELGWLLNDTIAMFAIVGSIVGICGLITSTSQNTSTRYNGLLIELVGLILAVCGPATYCAVQVMLIDDDVIRIAIAMFGYAFTAFMFARIVVVHRALKGM